MKNKWIIFASVFFIALKFFLIGVLWENRIIPPQADDAYIYIANIDSVNKCPTILCNDNNQYYTLKNYQGYTYLNYRLFGGMIGKILRIDSVSVFKLLFYIGTIFLLFSLIYLLNSLEQNKSLVALSIFSLALFNGMGYYHGFWWIVPSSFAVSLFLLILGIVFSQNTTYWKIKLFILSFLLIFTHPMGIYFNLSIPALVLIVWTLRLENIRLIITKVFFVFISSIIIYSPLIMYLSANDLHNPYGPESMLVRYSKIIDDHFFYNDNLQPENAADLPIIKTFYETNNEHVSGTLTDQEIVIDYYFSWIFFPYFLGSISFFLIFILLFYHKKIKILSLYAYFLIIVITGSFFQNGSRFLILLWPITYVLVAFGFFYVLRFINKEIENSLIKKIMGVVIFTLFTLFIIVNIYYSYSFNQSQNLAQNVNISRNYIDYIENQEYYKDNDNCVYFNSKLSLVFALYEGIDGSKVSESPENAYYYIANICKDSNMETQRTKLFALYTFIKNYIPGFKYKTGIDKQHDANDCNNNLPADIILDKQFDDILIYKKI